MTLPLPPKANLRHLKNRAKDLLQAHTRRERDVPDRIRSALREWNGLHDHVVFNRGFSLKDAQRVVAREYGFDTWADLTRSPAVGAPVKLKNLKQPSLDTTQMGVLRGVAKYLGLDASTATIFGATGHAFVINIHDELCPSGPFVWRRHRFNRLLRNLGIHTSDVGYYTHETPRAVREQVDARLRKAIDAGIACSLCNNEHQLITGYDDSGFFTVGPYPDALHRRLTFATWQEWEDNVYAYFYIHRKCKPASRSDMVSDSLAFALDLFGNPADFAYNDYGVGPDAYDRWLGAVAEFGDRFGNSWNARVWGECRKYAAAYMTEIATWFPSVSPPARAAAAKYRRISKNLYRVAEAGIASARKTELITEASELEQEAIEKLAEIHGVLRPLGSNPVGEPPPVGPRSADEPPLLAEMGAED